MRLPSIRFLELKTNFFILYIQKSWFTFIKKNLPVNNTHFEWTVDRKSSKSLGCRHGLCLSGLSWYSIWGGEPYITTPRAGQGNISLHGRGGFRMTLCPQILCFISGYVTDILFWFHQISSKLACFLSSFQTLTHITE